MSWINHVPDGSAIRPTIPTHDGNWGVPVRFTDKGTGRKDAETRREQQLLRGGRRQKKGAHQRGASSLALHQEPLADPQKNERIRMVLTISTGNYSHLPKKNQINDAEKFACRRTDGVRGSLRRHTGEEIRHQTLPCHARRTGLVSLCTARLPSLGSFFPKGRNSTADYSVVPEG